MNIILVQYFIFIIAIIDCILFGFKDFIYLPKVKILVFEFNNPIYNLMQITHI